MSGRTMGTSWNVSLIEQSGQPDEEQLQEDIAAILSAVNSSMSTYRQESEISRLNRSEEGEWFTVSREVMHVIQAALAVGEGTNGAYDVTVGPLVDRWGFGPGHQAPDIPPEVELRALLAVVGQDKLQFDLEKSAIMKPTGLSLDLSSIAKGYAVDQVAEYLIEQGVENFLVEVGGELRLSGLSGRGDPWRIAIEQPDSGGGRGVARAIAVTDTSVATSGDYRNYFEHDGKRYAHIIDPRTGRPAEHDLVSVTVIHPSAMMADGWATALTVLGADEAMEVARNHALAVYFIRREVDSFVSSHSAAFAPYLEATGNVQ
ncbi:MAG: FAD:protein FMN transferase [Halioglobus sp.]